MQLPKIKADGAIDDHDVYFLGDDGLKAGEGDVYRHNGDRLWPRSGNQMHLCSQAGKLDELCHGILFEDPLPPHTQIGEPSERANYLG